MTEAQRILRAKVERHRRMSKKEKRTEMLKKLYGIKTL